MSRGEGEGSDSGDRVTLHNPSPPVVEIGLRSAVVITCLALGIVLVLGSTPVLSLLLRS